MKVVDFLEAEFPRRRQKRVRDVAAMKKHLKENFLGGKAFMTDVKAGDSSIDKLTDKPSK